MKVALCTTTIHVPHALKLLRKCSPDVMFFIAGDRKSPDLEITRMLEDVPNHMYFVADWPNQWKCSKLIGENTLAKRNIAFLEALKWGADIIVAWDTDNYSINERYFSDFKDLFEVAPYKVVDGLICPEGTPAKFNGIVASGKEGWFDAGAYLRPPAKHRGFPIQRKHQPVYNTITDAKVGIAAGLILNDPDVDATTRIVQAPESQEVSLLMDAGVVVDLHTWTTVNTQNTAVVRDLIPAWFIGPGLERMDDIYAGMIVQRVGRERGYHVHVGQPFALQQRHPHDIIKDLRAEIEGYERVVQLAELLDSIMLVGKNTIDDTRKIYATLDHCEWYPKQAVKAAHAYLDDCESLA